MKKITLIVLALIFTVSMSFAGGGNEADTSMADENPLADLRVRQALMYGLDRVGFIEAEYGHPDLASLGLAPLSPASWAFPDGDGINTYPYDLEKAGGLLDDAGWMLNDDGLREKDGQLLELSWLVYTESTWTQTLSGMAFDSWGQLGVTLDIELMDFNTVAARTMDAPIDEKDFDIYTMAFGLSVDPDPSGALFDADAYTAGGFNATGFRDERSQELIALGKAEFDQDKRAVIYKEWALLQNELIPTVIVNYRNEFWAINERVEDFTIDTYVRWPYQIETVKLNSGDDFLTVGASGYKGVFNPILGDTVYDETVYNVIFEGLVATDISGSTYGDIASYEISADNLTYTFTLDDGIMFSNGTPMDTADVAFTYKTMARPEYNGPRAYAVSDLVGYEEFNSGATEDFAGIKIIDDKTISFTFKVAAPVNIEHFGYGIMEDEYYAYSNWEEFLALNEKPMGSGPFVFDSWAAKQFIRLNKNENYWNPAEAAQIAGILHLEVSDDTILSALDAGDIDFGQVSVNLDNFNAVNAMDHINLTNFLGNGYTFMAFNTVEK